MTAKVLEVCHTHIAIAYNLNAMGLNGSKSRRGQEAISQPDNTIKTSTTGITKTHALIAPSHINPAKPPGLLKNPPAKVADARATGSPGSKVVEHPNDKR